MQPFNLKCATVCCWFSQSTIKRKPHFPNFYKSDYKGNDLKWEMKEHKIIIVEPSLKKKKERERESARVSVGKDLPT